MFELSIERVAGDDPDEGPNEWKRNGEGAYSSHLSHPKAGIQVKASAYTSLDIGRRFSTEKAGSFNE